MAKWKRTNGEAVFRMVHNSIAKWKGVNGEAVIRMTHNAMAKWKGTNGEAVIRMTHNTMAKWKRTNGEAVVRMTHNTMAKWKGTNAEAVFRIIYNTMAKWKGTKGHTKQHTENYKDWATLTPLKPVVELECFGWLSSSRSTNDTRRVLLLQTRWQVTNEERTEQNISVVSCDRDTP